VPGNEHGNLRHHGIDKAKRGREVRQFLDGISDDASLLETREAIGARTNMRFQGGNAKTLLVVEEEVNFGGE
jgi:hypothetical protein